MRSQSFNAFVFILNFCLKNKPARHLKKILQVRSSRHHFVQSQQGDYENQTFNYQIYWKTTYLFCFPWVDWCLVKMQKSFVLTAEP